MSKAITSSKPCRLTSSVLTPYRGRDTKKTNDITANDQTINLYTGRNVERFGMSCSTMLALPSFLILWLMIYRHAIKAAIAMGISQRSFKYCGFPNSNIMLLFKE
jgi:hypothetical protein